MKALREEFSPSKFDITHTIFGGIENSHMVSHTNQSPFKFRDIDFECTLPPMV